MVIGPMAHPQRLETALGEAALRQMVLGFLAAAERPRQWTYFLAARPAVDRAPLPELIIEAGGRLAYVEICGQGSGRLDSRRAAGLALARCRGAASFLVRSLPEMEAVLRSFGIPLRPPGDLLAADDAQRRAGGVDGAQS